MSAVTWAVLVGRAQPTLIAPEIGVLVASMWTSVSASCRSFSRRWAGLRAIEPPRQRRLMLEGTKLCVSFHVLAVR